MEHASLDTTIRQMMDVITDARYAPMRLGLSLLGVVIADYFFIQLVRSDASTSTLLVYRAIERLLL